MRSRIALAVRYSLAFGALIFLAGCGGTGTVSGKVTLNGQPLPGGLVYFHHVGEPDEEIGAAPAGRIMADGSYIAAGVRVGKALVTVRTVSKMGSVMNPESVKEPWGPFVPIPKRFSDPDKSGFTIDVKTGNQDLDLPLTGGPAEDEAK